MKATKRILASLGGFALTCIGSNAHAAPPYVDRPITLPRFDWAFDLGLGVAHDDRVPPARPALNGVGVNLEGAVGITQHLELGVRTGARMNDDGRVLRADQYGRLFDRQTFGTGTDTFANPEVRLRGALLRGEVFELALEGRAILPFETGTDVGGMFGVPMAIHFGGAVRLDTGIYTPVIFARPVYYAFNIPLNVWIQATDKLWLGPMFGVRFHHRAIYNNGVVVVPDDNRTDVELGFGLGYSITRAIDFKTMAMFPRINESEGARIFGLGAGFQLRIE